MTAVGAVRDPLHVLVDGALDPALNMAIDDALLEAEGSWLRLYRWQPFAISLGYFQRLADFDDLPAELVRVRRPTGGGAILHAHELTIALALDQERLPSSIDASYAVLNDAVTEALAGIGIELTPGSGCPDPASRRERWCFAHGTRLDLLDASGRKVFGSAQRRRAGRILQHGSLILGHHPAAPFTGATGPIDLAALATGLERALATALGLAPAGVPALPAAMLDRVEQLRTGRYEAPGWTARS